jgi:hypothetical protein
MPVPQSCLYGRIAGGSVATNHAACLNLFAGPACTKDKGSVKMMMYRSTLRGSKNKSLILGWLIILSDVWWQRRKWSDIPEWHLDC